MPSYEEIVLKRIEDWRRRLIDLSYRNRLIRYRPTQATTLEFDAPGIEVLLEDPGRLAPWRFYFPPEPSEEDRDQLETEGAAAYVDNVVVREAQHADQPPRPDEIVVRGSLSARRINRILENLARRSNSEFQDKALRILYIAAGFLDWVDPARNEPLSSPLVLVPVELRRETARHPYALYFVDDEEIAINPSLTEKLRRDVDLDVPEDWLWEDKPISHELDEIEMAVADLGWSVRRDSVLGLFSFQKFVMYRDLLDNESQIVRHSVVQALGQGKLTDELLARDSEIPSLYELDDVQSPDTDLSILDADATQRRCLEATKRGQSFVMHGPPGTGKSQTIANIIGVAIGRGRRVLFVSEKAAALDVVHKRLAAQGLDEFCLLLHGEHAARREVVEALHKSLTTEIQPRPGLTSDQFERLRQLRELLNNTAELVHLPEPQLGDRSLRDVLGQLARLHAAPSVPASPPPTEVAGQDVRAELQRLDDLFQRIAELWHVGPKTFVWRGYVGDRFTADDHGRVLAIVETFGRAARRLDEAAADAARLIGWPVPINARAADRLLQLGRHLESAPALVEGWLLPGCAGRLFEVSEESEKTFEELSDTRRVFAGAYPEREPVSVRSELPGELNVRLKELGETAGRTDAWENGLLPALPRAGRFLASAPALIEETRSAASEAAALLGQPDEDFTLARAEAISRLATMAFRGEDRPERDWLVGAGVGRARDTLAEVGPMFERYRKEWRELLEHYEPATLDLDGAALLRRFTTEYTSTFSKLRGTYRRDAKAIRAARRDSKLPAAVVDDLDKLAKLQSLGDRIDEMSERSTRAFGSYFDGRESDPSRIERAIDVAEEVNRLAAPDSNLSRLGDQMAVGATASASIGQLADRLHAAMAELAAGREFLEPLLGRVDALPWDAPLSVLEDRIAALSRAIDSVALLVDELDAGSRSRAVDLSTLHERSQLVQRIHELEGKVAEREPHWRETLAVHYAGSASNWHAISETAVWLARFEELVGGAIPAELCAKLLDVKPRWPDFPGVEASRDQYVSAVEQVTGLFEPERQRELRQQAEQDEFGQIPELCSALEQSVDDLSDWTMFRSSRSEIREREWGDFLDALAERDVDSTEVVTAFRRAYWTRRLEALFRRDPELADPGTTYARWISEFRDLDRRLVRTAADRVIAARNRVRQPFVATRGSQIELLRREALKRRRHMPVRKLLAAIPNVLSELKPCLMMSPLTVSHFLAPTHHFDLVIFDEASQVPPQDAINCIYRGDQLVVAGDSKQLPPTPFFQVAEAEETWSEDDNETTEDMESILDSCQALLPLHSLLWHYRSRHESLIAFSNNHVYDGALLTFPSADSFSVSKGVRFIHVPDGIYDRGRSSTNRREAQVVAERVMSHLREGRHSVGVITFNLAQANAVSEELDRLRIENPDLEEHFAGDRLEAVFVKHLESVQGDERDVIVFSVGYGRDVEGKFYMNFGPLNKEGGYRRLNVAVTRGRDLVEVISSVRAADFSLSETASRGAHLLQEYIRYAETGATLSVGVEPRAGEFESQLELAIAEAVEQLGYQAVPEVGAGSFRIGIGVRSPSDREGFSLGIETDGHSYRSTPTARDRDRLREEVLNGLKWRIHRIWSLDWVRNRQNELNRLREALEAGTADTGDGLAEVAEVELPPRERTERMIEDLGEALKSGGLEWLAPYERVELPRQRGYYEFHESINRDKQRELLVELLGVEAPVHVDYAVRRLGEAWGLRRTGHRVRSAGLQAINMAVRREAAQLRGDFIWLPGQELTVVRQPNGDDDRTFRKVEEIPPEEIELAVSRLLDASGGALSGEHLISGVAKVLGFDRVGATIRAVLTDRIDAVVKAGIVE
jgi:hypothetical protein